MLPARALMLMTGTLAGAEFAVFCDVVILGIRGSLGSSPLYVGRAQLFPDGLHKAESFLLLRSLFLAAPARRRCLSSHAEKL